MRHRHLLTAALAVAAASVLFVGCKDSKSRGSKSCTTVADCDEGQICAAGSCAACQADAQCAADYGAGATCEAGVCTPASCPEGQVGCACKAGDVCDVGECVSGTCVDCTRGDDGCLCLEGDVCDAGLRCNASGLCEECPEGETGCACKTGEVCDEGECVQGTCTDCERGALDCRCYDGGTCDAGLRCNADSVCETCPAGEEGCPCDTGDVCDGGLICDNGVCITDPCPAGTDGCPCRANDECDDGLYCADTDLCAACSSDIVGCACDENDECQNDLVCDETEKTCREAFTCADLECAEHQLCQEGATATDDAVCLEECEAGWRWNAGGSACDELNCQPADPNSIAAECAGYNRQCMENPGGGATCGDCVTNFVDEGGTLETCRAVETCLTLDCAGKNRRCTEATATADATCDACEDFFVDDGGTLETCRAVETCTTLDCAGQHRECTAETATTDAACGACLAEYLDVGGTCYEENCVDGADGSILATCTAENRECVEDAALGADCGDCLAGYAENTDGDCQQTASCLAGDADFIDCDAFNRVCMDDGAFDYCGDCKEGTAEDPGDPTRCILPQTCADLTCGDTQFCIEGGPGENARCEDAPCNEGEAYSEHSGGCVTCVVACIDLGGDPVTGSTGRPWPYTLKDSDRCICETADGYYWNEGSNRGPRPCDSDGDGWLRLPARDAVRSEDQVLQQNARCDLKTVDRFVLRNEIGQELPVILCDGDPFFALDEATCTGGVRTLDIYETLRNDDQSTLDNPENDTQAPAYEQGGNGRPLRVEEINALTRACVTEGADYNDNKISDYQEWHGVAAPAAADPPWGADDVVFSHFSYFVELHRGYYRDGSQSLLIGEYVIEERSRCGDASEFNLQYGDLVGRVCDADHECGPGGPGDTVGVCAGGQCVSTYWRGCTRSRDAGYAEVTGTVGNPDTPNFGLDFARWSCSGGGTCAIPPPLTDAPPVAGQIPQHGLCHVPLLPPVDEECTGPDADTWTCLAGDSVWRGMSHHSQFRCVIVRPTVPDPPTEPVLVPAQFPGDFRMNQCHVACPGGDVTCAADCAGDRCATSSEDAAAGPNPSHAVLTCDAESVISPAEGTVGFAAVMYAHGGGGDYTRGCVNEWAPVATTQVGATQNSEVYSWRAMCPGWIDDYQATDGNGDVSDFGQLLCGCGENYGGLDCELGCPGEQLHTGADGGAYSPTPRKGYWMCGDFAATSYTAPDATYGPALVGQDGNGLDWVLRGEVPTAPTDRVPLCQNPGDCENGYTVR